MSNDTETKDKGQSPDIIVLYGVVEAATRDVRERMAEEDVARWASTAAGNRLADAQKAFDAAMAELRKTSPMGSPWHDQVPKRELIDPIAEMLDGRQ